MNDDEREWSEDEEYESEMDEGFCEENDLEVSLEPRIVSLLVTIILYFIKQFFNSSNYFYLFYV